MWSRVKARTGRFTLMTSNICETFNSRIADVKGLPVCHLVDYIRRFLMEWFCQRRQVARDWPHPLSKHAVDIIKERWVVANRFVACHVDTDEYEVDEGDYLEQHTVYLDRRYCACKVFDYQHFPCPHVLAVCETYKKKEEDLCGEYYKTSVWRSMYEPKIYGVLSPETWDVPTEVAEWVVLPPNTTPEVGLRSIKRKRSTIEKPRNKRACSRCHQTGHYANSRHYPKA
ncbi:hypothetical protein MKW98_026853 [Papaver atlanticum]|uniref:SWIM-type domain-containing protein n=1 Tax=Papaver atlanticum TaxID=357466 RepID=A0AAD4RZY3_9MAGN|nr:hypothetical protein MKW98_026853 [Papaver atlanticum]